MVCKLPPGNQKGAWYFMGALKQKTPEIRGFLRSKQPCLIQKTNMATVF
jgi:hypothetical protein